MMRDNLGSLETVKIKKKRITGTVGMLLVLSGMLCGCGDDDTVSMQAVNLESLAEPVVVERTEEAPEQTTAETDTASETLPELEQVTITISAAGDVTLGNHHQQDYYYSFAQAYDQAEDDSYFFQNVYDIFAEDDLTLVNLEGPLTTSEEQREGQTYSIKGQPAYAGILTAGSVEAVAMANNHRLDYGASGTTDTKAALEQEGIAYAYDDLVSVYETKGIRIGMISVNEVGWGSGVEKLIQDGIAELQQEEADLILVSCHWGIERETIPEAYQQALGRKCIDWGADLVLGHHPHVLQGIEEYQGKYIVYSLANFCFGANRNPEDKDTMIFQQTFTFTEGERQQETTARVIPCMVSSITTRNDFCPTPAQGMDQERILGRLQEHSEALGVTIQEDGTLQ